ncbi:MAG: pantoate--beta-alanine ligase [Firmicutes bacterium]|nr:pantoate--beta-alanine ligase [Bacillota bacterium]
MEIISSIPELRRRIEAFRAGGAGPGTEPGSLSVGFVPTMGWLHNGHLALVRTARKADDLVVVSIFVNPIQFGPGEDYDRYPRDLERDAGMTSAAEADLLFVPSTAEMYPVGHSTTVEVVGGLTGHLCGASRPGHFRGVTTVVAKLLNIVRPRRAYFGWKDAQQLLVVRRMVRDLNLGVEIVGVPTVREPDGLAMSSRNGYLSGQERLAARAIPRSLERVRFMIQNGERDAATIRREAAGIVAAEPLLAIDYLAVVDGNTLEEIERIRGTVMVALAVHAGKTRLIDNIRMEVGG